MYSSETPGSRMNMNVDNEHFRRTMTVSGSGIHEAAMRISQADVQTSRHLISEYLSHNTVFELFPESDKVTSFDVNLPVKQAFHILYEQVIATAPLWDCYRGQIVGVLTALNFILILRELRNHGSNLTEEELDDACQIFWSLEERDCMEIEFWDIEVKPGESVICDPGKETYLHISQATLGETKKSSENVFFIPKLMIIN